MDHVVLNHGQVTWMAPPSPNYRSNGRTFQPSTDSTCIAALHGGSLVVLVTRVLLLHFNVGNEPRLYEIERMQKGHISAFTCGEFNYASVLKSGQPFMSPRYPGGPRPGVRMPQQVEFNVSTVIIFITRLGIVGQKCIDGETTSCQPQRIHFRDQIGKCIVHLDRYPQWLQQRRPKRCVSKHIVAFTAAFGPVQPMLETCPHANSVCCGQWEHQHRIEESRLV
ncbi:hypothetical protein TNCV_2377101 [Trichonephila clavipes]|nr:hypothetical protein TNCV_2377101 [Trichonephila clavipes]